MVTQPVSVGVISGLPIVAVGVESLLRGQERIVVVEPTDADRVDVVLFDPTGNPGQDDQRLAEIAADPRFGHIVMYATSFSMRSVREARRVGVRSFLSKSLPANDLVEAIVEIAHGVAVDPNRSEGPPPPVTWFGQQDGLTERESHVLCLCADGLSNQQIADRLYINVETVKSHLKHVYSRLGFRNRAQAVAYVHRSSTSGRMVSFERSGRGRSAGLGSAELEQYVDERSLAERLELLRLGGDARSRLRPHAVTVAAGVDAFVDRLLARWNDHDELAALISEPAVAKRLVEHHRRYLVDLFTADYDRSHGVAMLRVGMTHHRIGLSPQWYLASYVHVICEHLLPFAAEGDIDGIGALIASALFDVGLVLDAYEMAVTAEIRLEHEPTHSAADGPEPSHDQPQPTEESVAHRHPMSKVHDRVDDTNERRRFIGIDDDVIARLRGLTSVVQAAMPAVLADFYELVADNTTLAPLVTGDAVERLMGQVPRFWQECTEGSFDRAHAASRLRVGVVHERVNLPPQLYLAGVSHQLTGLLRAMARSSTDLHSDADAIVRAAFFDMTFVVDAYLDARADALMQTGQFASQVVAGLANGVAIVDSRDRVEFANEHFLDLVGVPPTVLLRMPVDAALSIPGVGSLVEAARSTPTGRSTGIYSVRTRTLRLIALRLDEAAAGRAGMVALIVDDISDVMRTLADREHEDRRFEHVLDALHAMAWEVDAVSMTVLAVSHSAQALTGRSEVEVIGRPAAEALVPPDDLARIVGAVADLGEGGRVTLDHGLLGIDPSGVRVRSSIVVSTTPAGNRTINGVSSMPLAG